VSPHGYTSSRETQPSGYTWRPHVGGRDASGPPDEQVEHGIERARRDGSPDPIACLPPRRAGGKVPEAYRARNRAVMVRLTDSPFDERMTSLTVSLPVPRRRSARRARLPTETRTVADSPAAIVRLPRTVTL
jgi:hypothetical protein